MGSVGDRIRIESDPHHFAGSESAFRHADPETADPDSADWIGINTKHMYFLLFSRKFKYAVQNTLNHDTFATDEKGKTL